MIVKHILFFNGSYVTVWGPEDRLKAYHAFLKEVASEMGCSLTLMVYALQLSDVWSKVTDLQAYIAWSNIQWYVQNILPRKFPITQQITLQCDSFLSSSPSSSYPTFQLPTANVVHTPLDQLTEILANKRQSKSDGIISELRPRRTFLQFPTIRVLSVRRLIQRLIPPVPIITFLLVTIALFGCLLAPIS